MKWSAKMEILIDMAKGKAQRGTTRFLGDSSMKEFVVGAPYTTETDLTEEDEFIILACDGVSGSYSTFRIQEISC